MSSPVVSATSMSFHIMTTVAATAIMEWKVGVPFSGQIRQTAADRTDFAY